MAIPQSLIQQWLQKPVTRQTLQTRDRILTDEDFTQASKDVLGFVFLLILSCKPNDANRVLEKLFQAPEFSASLDEQLVLEFFWSAFSGKPDNTPWDQDIGHLDEARKLADPRNVDFYEDWTKTEWIAKMLNISIGPDYDADQWKGSQDSWVHAIGARILCQPMDGNPPSPEAVEEAFEAVDKLFMMLPLRGPNMPHGHIFSWRVYFILGLYLDHTEKARHILHLASQWEEFDLHHFLDVPALHEMLAASTDAPPIHILDDAELKEVEVQILAALTTRVEQGRRGPLHDFSMSELMLRFSEAALFVHRDEYPKNNINSSQEILCAPITEAEITKLKKHWVRFHPT